MSRTGLCCGHTPQAAPPAALPDGCATLDTDPRICAGRQTHVLHPVLSSGCQAFFLCLPGRGACIRTCPSGACATAACVWDWQQCTHSMCSLQRSMQCMSCCVRAPLSHPALLATNTQPHRDRQAV
jgi:hypothetical protein